jgi:hypothetical protein
MDKFRLTVLRGHLQALETGFAVQMYDANEVREAAESLADNYPDMPDEERARVDTLKLAGHAGRGLIC